MWVYPCKVVEYEDDGAVFLLTEAGDDINIFLEDFEWRRVYKCRECGEFDACSLRCTKCNTLRAAGVVQECANSS